MLQRTQLLKIIQERRVFKAFKQCDENFFQDIGIFFLDILIKVIIIVITIKYGGEYGKENYGVSGR